MIGMTIRVEESGLDGGASSHARSSRHLRRPSPRRSWLEAIGHIGHQIASSQGHGATPSQGHGARETERTTEFEGASDRARRLLVEIESLDGASGDIFAGSWGHPADRARWFGRAGRAAHDQRRRRERRRRDGCFIAGALGGGSASSIFGLSLDRYDSPSTTKS